MFSKSVLFSFIAFTFFLTAPLAAAQQNTRLERQIRREIMTLPYYNVFDAIGYQINGDTVTLTGYVVRPSTSRSAAEAIGDLEGVREVKNQIVVLPVSPSDDRIRRNVLRTLVNRGGSLYRYFMGTNPSIRIIVNRGRVTLEGYVDNRSDSSTAYILTRGVSGTFGVTNNLQVIREPR